MMSTVPSRQHVDDSSAEFDALLHRVVALNRRFGAIGEALARPTGHSFARVLVMREAQAEPASVAQLARRLRLSRQAVQRMADAMAADGLISYAENPRHRRAKLVQVSDAGRDVLERIAAAQQSWAQRLGDRLGAAKLAQANDLLDEILAAVAQD